MIAKKLRGFKNSQKKILEKAAQHSLCEVLGFDEGRAYYFLLFKKEKELEKEFSYSKKYRLLRNLFESGALGKIKPQGREFFGYVILPPSFLHFTDISKEIIMFLEKVYLKNHAKKLISEFSQLMLKDEKPLALFLIRYVMEKRARFFGAVNLEKNKLPSDSVNKIEIIYLKNSEKKIGVIDNKILFEFSVLKNSRGYDCIGYITNKAGEEYIKLLERKFKK